MAIPRLTRSGWIYYSVVVAAGLLALTWAVHDLVVHYALLDTNLVFLVALTILGVFATIRVPALPVTLSVAEAFFFMIVLLYGAGAGTLVVALEALVIWWRLVRKGNPATKIIFTLCANSVAMALGGWLFFALAPIPPLASGTFDKSQVASLIPPLMTLAAVYFLLSSWLVAVAIAFERHALSVKVWWDNFAWLFFNYLGAASLALLFVVYVPLANPIFLLVIGPPIVLLYLTYATTTKRVQEAKNHLESLNSLYLATIETLATAIDAKDQVTHGHIRRVQQLAVSLAKALGLDDEQLIKAIEAASLLHDMGKLAVPDYILNKPGPLTPTEFEKMKLHASVGADILSSIRFPYPVVPIVRHHHENWDGSGYPDGLVGNSIPVGARILSVVDCFDALTSDRPYRPRLSDEAALQIILQRRGAMYDPEVVDKFFSIHGELVAGFADMPARPAALAAITEAANPVPDQSHLRFEEIAASSEEMLTLYEIARAVGGPFNFEDAAAVIARHLRRLIPSTYCVFFAYDERTDELYAAHAAGDASGAFAGLRISLGQRLTGWVGANRQTILNSDPVLDLGESARVMRPPLRSCLSTPLVADTVLVGVLTLYSGTKNAFNENHCRIIEAVSRQVAGTLRKALEFESQKKSSLRDDLTGLPSIERLRYITENSPDSAGSEQDGASIILVDVDFFREINQRLGRSAGDRILSIVAATLRRNLQGTELLFRSTSDEFVIFLARTDRESAERRARSLRAAIVQAQIASPVGARHISVSVAVASVPADGTSMEMALSVAERRLHSALSPGSSPNGSSSVH